MKLVKLNFTFIAIVFAFSLSAQEMPPAFIQDSLNSYIEKAMEKWNIPGVAVGIVKNGEVVFQKGYGVKQVESGNPVDENTLFMIGSNSKAFTGTALAKLDYEGQLSLEDKVQTWLPQFTMMDEEVAMRMNLIDIVSHRTGMETFQGDFMYFDSDLSTNDLMSKFGLLEPKYEFRTKWGYCNAGYVMAGEVIREVSGKSWNNYFDESIFTPLKMNRTVTTIAEISADANATKPHSIVNDTLKEIPYGGLDLIGPAGSISSSILEMNHWTQMLLDSGRFEGDQVIPYDVIKRTRKPESIIGNNRHSFNNTHYKLYGLGWELMDYENHGIVCHTGGIHGYLSSVTLVPDENLGVVILTNTDQNWFFDALKWEIVDAYLDLPYRNYSDNYYTAYERQTKLDRENLQALKDSALLKIEPPIALRHFEGKYEDAVYGYAEIYQEDDHLVLTLQHHPNLKGKLEYLGGDSFLCTYSNPLVGVKVFPFKWQDKSVLSFTLSVADYLEFTSYEFVKAN